MRSQSGCIGKYLLEDETQRVVICRKEVKPQGSAGFLALGDLRGCRYKVLEADEVFGADAELNNDPNRQRCAPGIDTKTGSSSFLKERTKKTLTVKNWSSSP
jgi:hypothetical protein